MKLGVRCLAVVYLSLQLHAVGRAQSALNARDTTYTLVGDTLYTNQNFKYSWDNVL